MAWLEEWRGLAARIDGLLRAGEFLVSTFTVHRNDERQAFRKSLLPEFKAITDAIIALGEGHGTELPPKAFQALKRYRSYDWHEQVATLGASDSTYAIQVLAPIAAFRSEFEYLIRDAEFEARSLTELAFEHLRRQIVVDDDVRKKWNAAYNRHETACERLGAVHLLSHGIWAFKITAPGAATDLVYGDPLSGRGIVMKRIARALVLTEWKLVKQADDIDAKAQEGRKQTALYAAGVLGDLELKRTRYVVLVCGSELQPLGDVEDGGVTYRHVVVSIKPKSPSQIARSRSHS